MKNMSLQETMISVPARSKEKGMGIYLTEEDISNLLTHSKGRLAKQHPIKKSTLKDSDLDIGADGIPRYGFINERFGLFTKKEIHLNSGRYGRGLILSPFGAPDDSLWVRETWRIGAWDEHEGLLVIDYKTSPDMDNRPWVQIQNDPTGNRFTEYWIELSNELHDKGVATDDDGRYQWEEGQAPLKWRSPAVMPKWASRLTVKVIDVKIIRNTNPDEHSTEWAFYTILELEKT